MESTRIGARLKRDGVILYRIDARFVLYGVTFYYGFVLPVALFFTPVAFGSSFGEFWAWMTADGDLWRSVLVVASEPRAGREDEGRHHEEKDRTAHRTSMHTGARGP